MRKEESKKKVEFAKGKVLRHALRRINNEDKRNHDPPRHVRRIGYNEPRANILYTNMRGSIILTPKEWHDQSSDVQEFIRHYNRLLRDNKDPSSIEVPEGKVIRPRPRNAGIFRQARRIQAETKESKDSTPNYKTSDNYVCDLTTCRDSTEKTTKDVEMKDRKISQEGVYPKKSIVLDLYPTSSSTQE